MVFPVGRAMRALRDGDIDFVAGPAHPTLSAFPGWQGAKLLAALSQHTFWLLVMRSDLGSWARRCGGGQGPAHRRGSRARCRPAPAAG